MEENDALNEPVSSAVDGARTDAAELPPQITDDVDPSRETGEDGPEDMTQEDTTQEDATADTTSADAPRDAPAEDAEAHANYYGWLAGGAASVAAAWLAWFSVGRWRRRNR